MRSSGLRPILASVEVSEEYAVFWRDPAKRHSLYAGGLAVRKDAVRLRGSDGGTPVVRDVPGEEIEAISPASGEEPIADFPSFRLDLRSGGSIVLAATTGGAALYEIVGALMNLIGGM